MYRHGSRFVECMRILINIWCPKIPVRNKKHNAGTMVSVNNLSIHLSVKYKITKKCLSLISSLSTDLLLLLPPKKYIVYPWARLEGAANHIQAGPVQQEEFQKRTFCITWVLIVPAIKHPKQHWSLNGTTIITYLKVRYIKIQTEIVCYMLSIGPVAGKMLHLRKQQQIRSKSGLDCQLGEYLSPNNHILAGINIPHWYFWNGRRPHKITYLTTKNRRANEEKQICSPTFLGETCVSLIDDG